LVVVDVGGKEFCIFVLDFEMKVGQIILFYFFVGSSGSNYFKKSSGSNGSNGSTGQRVKRVKRVKRVLGFAGFAGLRDLRDEIKTS
jgi:hypothetical protein